MHQIRTTEDIKQLGTILCVWAHPDDECFVAAGIMIVAIQNGQQVACVTATKGEVGIQDSSKYTLQTITRVREGEMHHALDIIGCKQHAWMGYTDGDCKTVDTEEAVAKIQQAIIDVRPDTILTFGPDGWTGHSDHQTVSKWVSAAVVDTDIAVYHAAITMRQYNQGLRALDEKLQIFYQLDKPYFVKESDCDVYFALPDSVCEQKCSALAAHQSQTQKMFDEFSHRYLCDAFGIEAFVCATK